MNFTREQIAAACRKHAGELEPSRLAGYDPAQLLWAICGNESSFGADCIQRHEPAYDVGGTYATAPQQAALLAKYGAHAACSYGPMQVLLVNAPHGYTPASFEDLDQGIAAGAYALNRLMGHWRPQSLAQFGAIYNAGHIPKLVSPGVHRYQEDLIRNYHVAMPEEAL